MRAEAMAVVKIARIMDTLAPDEQRRVAFAIHRTYGGALTAAERSARWREAHPPASRKRNEKRNENATAERDAAQRSVCSTPVVSKSLTATTETAGKDTLPSAGNENVSETFAAFYAAYPRKVAPSKAREAWRKARPPLDKVLAALAWQRQLPDWTKDDGRFVPHPTTYINGKRWEDEPVNGSAPERRNVNDAWKGKTEAREVKL